VCNKRATIASVESFSAVLGGAEGEAPTLELPFDALSHTHRREYAEWIAAAKREDTRERRAAQAVEMLRAGTKSP
jgi:uncharacterized protein YdeI (YjbR/CyaY-like superfamily)